MDRKKAVVISSFSVLFVFVFVLGVFTGTVVVGDNRVENEVAPGVPVVEQPVRVVGYLAPADFSIQTALLGSRASSPWDELLAAATTLSTDTSRGLCSREFASRAASTDWLGRSDRFEAFDSDLAIQSRFSFPLLNAQAESPLKATIHPKYAPFSLGKRNGLPGFQAPSEHTTGFFARGEFGDRSSRGFFGRFEGADAFKNSDLQSASPNFNLTHRFAPSTALSAC